MEKDPTRIIIDNKAKILEEEKEGSVLDIFEYYVNQADKIKNENDFRLRMDIGTGYLFFSGFRETAHLFRRLMQEGLLKKIEEASWMSKAPIRVVMGPETTGFTKEVLISIVKNDISEYSDDDVELLKSLVNLDLIDFRVFLGKKFHVKLYNFYLRSSIPDDIWAGSANFTRGGLTSNIELCIPMRTTSQTRTLFRKWFDKLWEQSTSDLNVLQIINIITRSRYIHYHPRIFFSKIIKLLDKEYLLREEEEWTEDLLLEFQNLSYYIVMERLKKYGGYILANSVGLGKSYVACKAMRAFLKQRPDRKCLLIYPPRLKREWDNYLNKFGISHKVDMISTGMLQKTPYNERKKGEKIYFDHRNLSEKYSLIVVDEIHHFRNVSNRRKNLYNVLGGNLGSKNLFLSATPVNLSLDDLFQIIDLFYRGENVHNFENEGIRDLYDRTRSDVKLIGRGNKEKLNKEVLDRIKRIERELSLKISWRIVQKHFQDDLNKLCGKKVNYQEPETKEITYTYSDELKKRIFDRIVPFLRSLNYEPAKLWDGQGYKDDKNLTFWYKWQLYKRLESSLYSFYKSIQNLRDRFYVFLYTLNRGEMLTENSLTLLPDISKTRYEEIVDKERLKVVVDSFLELEQPLKAKILQRLEEDLRNIEQMLSNLKEEFGKIREFPYSGDSKLRALKKILKANLKKNRPTIVFSEWKDTIYYLYESLKGEFDKIDYIFGGSEKSKDRMIEEFQNGEIDIILTTDVLAEGVNIPRADCIINFDLPYNPVLLVQRAGRALRITNPKKIYVYNFRPEDDIDKELDLYKRLDVRLKTILDIIGLDFVIWMMDEKEIKVIYEKEMKKYLDNYSEYKKQIATTNPDNFVDGTLPEESKFDKVLRKSIYRYNITPDFLENISARWGKPVYTTLRGENGFFYITKVGNRFKIINDIRESLERTRDRSITRIDKLDQQTIKKELNKAEKEILLERTSKRDVPRDVNTLINELKISKDKLEKQDMKETLDKVIELLGNGVYQPEEIENIEKAVKELKEYPSFFKSIDAIIGEKEFWSNLEKLSKKVLLEEKVKLKAFIKYAETE